MKSLKIYLVKQSAVVSIITICKVLLELGIENTERYIHDYYIFYPFGWRSNSCFGSGFRFFHGLQKAYTSCSQGFSRYSFVLGLNLYHNSIPKILRGRGKRFTDPLFLFISSYIPPLSFPLHCRRLLNKFGFIAMYIRTKVWMTNL